MDSAPVSPTAKVLLALEAIQRHPGIRADELAGRLGVTDRAVRRYVAILREAEVPIESTPGRYGGYRLGRSLSPPPLLFTASEALGLVMAVLDGHHAAADPDDPVGSALGKLIASLPDHTGAQAATVRRHALAAPDRRAARPDPVVTTALVQAVEARCAVRLSYVTGAGDGIEAEVEPWAIVVRHGRWYLAAATRPAGSARAYRIDRVVSVDRLNVAVEPPDGLNPVTWLETHLGSDRAHRTVVELDAPIGLVAPRVTPPMGRLEPLEGGARCRLVGSTDNPAMYVGEWLASLPFPFRVIGGPELLAATAELAERLAAAVGEVQPDA